MSDRTGSDHRNPTSARESAVLRGDSSRQAVDALRGYAYQIYRSVLAWIRLTGEEELHLEVAEDYAVLTSSMCVVTQVKDTPSTTITLNSESVRKGIQSLWNLKEEAPGVDVRFGFLTTSAIGKERNGHFPGDQPGLDYWRAAARETGDPAPIREALKQANFSDDLQGFISDSNDQQFRQRILKAMSFECGAADSAGTQRQIRKLLVDHGDKHQVPPQESELVLDALVAEVLRTVTQRDGRRLTRADYLRHFENRTMSSVPNATLRELTSVIRHRSFSAQSPTEFAHQSEWLSDLPLPSRLAERETITSDLWARLGRSGSLWLHGSSGTGKSTLAQLVARRSSGKWLRVELRDLDSNGISNRLRSLVVDGAVGAVLEDLSISLDSSALQRIAIVARAVRDTDGCMIITSANEPTALIRDAVGGCDVVRVPYLTLDEVRRLIEAAGGDGERWGRSVYVFCSGGHPQLVAARISGLSFRGWPAGELFPVGPTGAVVSDVDEERARIRRRLVNELPSNHRDHLYRLALVIGTFDRSLARAVAALPTPGEILDSLEGPWIERVAPDAFRVSPLVAGSAQSLSTQEQAKVHRAIVEHLLQRRPFPSKFLNHMLMHALSCQHVPGLSWLAVAVLSARQHEQRIAEQLFLLPFLNLEGGEPIIPASPEASAMLRCAQWKVAVLLDPKDSRLEAILDRVDDASRRLPESVRPTFRFIALGRILEDLSVSIRASRWLPLLEEFARLLEDPRHSKLVGDSQLCATTVRSSHFFLRAARVSTVEMLTELMTTLDRFDQQSREHYLAALRETEDGAQLVVGSAWEREDRNGMLTEDRGRHVAAEFLRLSFLAEGWLASDLAVELVCAQIVVLDEYVHQAAEALSAANAAEARFSGELRLARRRHMIHFRQGDYRAAIDAVGNFEVHLARMSAIDAAFFTRRVGFCFAETGALAEASRAFALGHLRLGNVDIDSMLPMKVGLIADQARVEFERGNASASVALLTEALRIAESMPLDRGLPERWCWIALGQAIKWLWWRAEGPNWRSDPVEIPYGVCSNPDPPDACKSWKVTDPLACWYTLATAEAILGTGADALNEVRNRTATVFLPFSEQILRHRILTAAICNGSLAPFRESMPEYLTLRSRLSQVLPLDPCRTMTRENFAQLPESLETVIFDATNACWALLASLAIKRKPGGASSASSLLAGECWVPNIVRDLLRVYSETTRPPRTFEEQLFRSLRVLDLDSPPPEDLFLATFTAWQWLPRSDFSAAVELDLSEFLGASWTRTAEERSFALKRPRQTVPAIRAAVRDLRSGRAKLASILIAAEDAVDVSVTAEMRTQIRDSASVSGLTPK